MRPDKFDMLTCVQCGEYHPKSNHRKYFPSQTKGEDRDSYYKQCKRCERINKRYTYLKKKENPTEQDLHDISVTEELFKELAARGLDVPSFGAKRNDDSATELLNKIRKNRRAPELLDAQTVPTEFAECPEDLVSMLTKDLHGIEPDKLYEEYDALKEKYAPQISVDNDFNPVYDDTHSDILKQILDRINAYEDEIL